VEDLNKQIVIPIDGSKNSMRSFDYLDLIFGYRQNIDIHLLYIIPALPPILTDKETKDERIRAELKVVEKKNVQLAERILAKAKAALMEKGFAEKRINTFYKKTEITTAKDINYWVNGRKVDAVLLTRRGRSDLKSFFMGSVTQRLLEYHPFCPVWVVEGGVRSNKVLICLDASENALEGVDYAGFMLSGTDCRITLFHSMRRLRRYVPKEVLMEAHDLDQLWKEQAGRQISLNMQKAREMLLDTGLDSKQINTKVVNGSRSAAYDILKEANDNDYGTIVLGRRGVSALKEFIMGSVASKILHNSVGFAVWVV
jgi:nucleotide-binding universal stress UspA family protein